MNNSMNQTPASRRRGLWRRAHEIVMRRNNAAQEIKVPAAGQSLGILESAIDALNGRRVVVRKRALAAILASIGLVLIGFIVASETPPVRPTITELTLPVAVSEKAVASIPERKTRTAEHENFGFVVISVGSLLISILMLCFAIPELWQHWRTGILIGVVAACIVIALHFAFKAEMQPIKMECLVDLTCDFTLIQATDGVGAERLFVRAQVQAFEGKREKLQKTIRELERAPGESDVEHDYPTTMTALYLAAGEQVPTRLQPVLESAMRLRETLLDLRTGINAGAFLMLLIFLWWFVVDRLLLRSQRKLLRMTETN